MSNPASMNKQSLREIQQEFQRTILESDYLTPNSQSQQIYSGAYRQRIYKSFISDFPRTHHYLGAEEFTILLKEYLRLCPSTTFNIAEVGKDFPQFLQSHRLPFLRDLAELEWSAAIAHYSLDHAAENQIKLENLAPHEWEKLKLELDPSVELHSSSYNLIELLEQDQLNQAQMNQIETRHSKYHFVVNKFEEKSQTSLITDAQFMVLKLLQNEPIFLNLCRALENKNYAQISDLQAWFSEWTTNHILLLKIR